MVFGDAKKADMTQEEFKKAWAEYSKALEKHKLKMKALLGHSVSKKALHSFLKDPLKTLRNT